MKALVLKKIAYGEKDLIVHFLLESGEQKAGFAAGARISKKRFPHQFDITGIYDLELGAQSGLQKLSSIHRCELIEYSSHLSEDFEIHCRWAIILEWLYWNAESTQSFESVSRLRTDLMKRGLQQTYYSYFLEQIEEHGFKPHLDSCFVCQKQLSEKIYFQIQEGTFSHDFCARGKNVSFETYSFIAKFFEKKDIKLTEKIALELDVLLIPFLEAQLERPFKSYKVFDELKNLNSLRN